jgi:uncharacterized protein (TIGR02145 family)
MKKYINLVLTILVLTTSNYVVAQSVLKIGTNSTTINPSAVLEVESTTKGLLPSRMTQCQKASIPSPTAGLWVWCTDCGNKGELQVYNGTTWQKVAGGSPSIPTVLDKVALPSLCAYSLRKLSACYTGNAIRVIRSSDNTQQDIGFDANGNLNQTALLAFAGSGSAFVAIWYDQSGNGRNATTQNNGDNQIVNNGVINTFNGRAGIVSGLLGADTSLLAATIPTNTATLSANIVSAINVTNADLSRLLSLKIGAQAGFYDDTNVNRGALLITTNSNTGLTGIRAYTTMSSASFSLGTKFVATTIYDGTNNTLFVNGTSTNSVASTGTFTQQALQLFNGDYSNTRPYKGTTTEVILYNVALTSAQRQALENDQVAYYSVLPNSAPSALNYIGSPFSFIINTAISDIAAPTNTGGTPTTYSISPGLPAGLTFNTATGAITGTPTVLSAATSYTITASNSGGSTTTTISIAVSLAPSDLVLQQIGNEGDSPNTVPSVVTVAQINTISPAISGAVLSNQSAYQAYIDANPNLFSEPATQAEVQAMVNAVNANVTSVLAQIGNEGDSPNTVPSVVTTTQLIAIGITGVVPANQSAYQAYIDANPNLFSAPATQAEVQAMVTAVNVGTIASIDCSGATAIGTLTDGIAASGVSSVISYTGGNGGLYSVQTVTSTGVTGLTATLTASSFATGAGSLTYTITGTPSGVGTATFAINIGGRSCTLTRTVVAQFSIPTSITLGQTIRTFVYSILDSDHVPYTTPTVAAEVPSGSLSEVADGVADDTIDKQGVITTTGIAVSIPATTTGSGTLPAYSTTINIPASLTQDGIARDVIFSWDAQAYNGGTTNINATLKAVGGTLNVIKLDVQSGIGNDRLGILMGTFNYPYNNAGQITTHQLRAKASECGAYTAPGVYTVFLCHNLGADESLDPNIPVKDIHGNYYQWGRGNFVATVNTSAPAIAGWNATAAPNGAWLDASKTANDPCPAGFKVPSRAQWTGVVNTSLNTVSRTGSWADNYSNFTTAIHYGPSASVKTLTLPVTGYRFNTNGEGLYRGTVARYWSSTENSFETADAIGFESTVSQIYTLRFRTFGYPVRCVIE